MQPFSLSICHTVNHRILFLLSVLIFCPFSDFDTLYAFQNGNGNENAEEAGTDHEKVVRKIRFTGNNHVRDRTLNGLIRTQTNRELLGIPRFTPWYYIWQLTGRFGESPSLLDREVVANDMERIRLYYENIGFFETSVDTAIIEYRPDRIEVSFIIDEGTPSRIHTISYSGVPEFDDTETRNEFFSNNLFSQNAVNDSTFGVHVRYNAQQLRQEQLRVINFLKDNGYAAVQRDSVRALIKRDENNPHILDVLFSIDSGNKYTFGNLYMSLAGPAGGESDSSRTLEITDGESVTAGKTIYLELEESAQSKPYLLTEQILFRPGDTFNNSLYLRSVNEFQNLGMLRIQRFGFSEDGSLPDYSYQEIPVYFDFQTIPKHSIRGEFFGMRRYGFGTGFGVNYTNNNLMGRAENMTIGFNTNLEYVTSSTLRDISPGGTDRNFSTDGQVFQSYEARADFSVPRLNFPFSVLDKQPYFTSARTTYSLTYSQSNQLYFDINSDIRFNLRYEVTHSDRFSSFLDLFEVDIIDTDPSAEFRQNLIDEFGEDSFEFQRIEEDFRPQFSSIIRYTFRSQNTDLIKRNFGYFSEYTFSVGGNVPYLMDRLLFSPGDVNRTLPSPLGLSENALGYSQFFKLSLDYRNYIPVGPEAVFAYRGFLGYAHPYHMSETIPLSRRFFAGGSNDIRGWAPFRLGPGEIQPDEVSINGGEIKLAAFTELRQIMFREFLSADWFLAWFSDAGNVWYGPRNNFRDQDNVDILEDGKFFIDRFYKQIAVGSGLGIRLDWDYIVARFDFAFRIHDLQRGWLNNGRMYFSFGIGHSF
ncbi:MAG: BamA/TamA family outer membrane protein [Balneolaceae bacterium]